MNCNPSEAVVRLRQAEKVGCGITKETKILRTSNSHAEMQKRGVVKFDKIMGKYRRTK